MDKKTVFKNILTVILIVLLLFSVWQLRLTNKKLYLSQNKLQSIEAEMNQEKKQYALEIQGLNSEIDFRNKHLEAANQQLTATAIQLNTANQELTIAKAQLEKLDALKTENANLLDLRQKLEQKIADLENEKQSTEKKLGSLVELRKLIRQAKIENHKQKIQSVIERKYRQKAADKQETSWGNKGFIIKDSKSTYKNTIRIEVKPVN